MTKPIGVKAGIVTGLFMIIFIFNTIALLQSIGGLRTGEYSIFSCLGFLFVEISCGAILWVLFNKYKKEKDELPISQRSADFGRNEYEIFASRVMNHDGTKSLQFSYIGGSYNKLQINSSICLGVEESKIVFHKVNELELYELKINEIISIEVDGPGTVKSDAGIAGGGFGVEGFIKGAVAAAVINKITEKSITNTFLRVMTKDAEYYLHTSEIEPLALRNLLSPLFIKLQLRKNTPVVAGDTSSQLEKLFNLKNQGALSEQEYDAAKKRILSS